MKVGLLSDTHGWLDKRVVKFFRECEEVWHCGDVGTVSVIEELQKCFRVRAVYGNIDGGEVRRTFSETLEWQCEEATILMTHIGGYPGKYDPRIKKRLIQNPPNLFISGHSHILRVLYDKQLSCLHINPGAAGIQGWQTVRTLVRFTIDGKDFRDLEVIELS